ncbi:MAG: hypothetical protein DLM69_07545, partial [Candidatus Chloroheliales bacterium]
EVVTLDRGDYRLSEEKPAPKPKTHLGVEESLLSLLLRYPALIEDVFVPEITEFGGTEARLLYSTMLNYSVAELEKDSGVDKVTNRLPLPQKSGEGIDDAGIIDDDDPAMPYPVLRQALDPALRGFLLRLLQVAAQEPALIGRELEQELKARVRRLRSRRDKLWLRRAEVILKDLQDNGERDEASYIAMLNEVNSRLPLLRAYAPPPSPVFRDSRDGTL